mmetsp:Transcript_27868/g.49477  ORF Transcript_27868/g.49477 Transcript_27868/m.49477 type:complete len:182 (+) Transcript_27868:55-600(+)
MDGSSSATTRPSEIVEGATSSDMAYLWCSNQNNNQDAKQIVLLHGSSFTKETWQSDDMLLQFCAGSKSVIALDFPVSTNYVGLMQVLDEVKTSSNDRQLFLSEEPVTLVTPSASGYSVVSWIINGDITQLPDYISEWVPVATGCLVSASDEQIAPLATLSDFRILAINGNEDRAGGVPMIL